MKYERLIKHDPAKTSKRKEGLTTSKILLSGKLTKKLNKKSGYQIKGVDVNKATVREDI